MKPCSREIVGRGSTFVALSQTTATDGSRESSHRSEIPESICEYGPVLLPAVTEGQRREGLTAGPYAASLTGAWQKMKSAEGIDDHFFTGNAQASLSQVFLGGLQLASNTGKKTY